MKTKVALQPKEFTLQDAHSTMLEVANATTRIKHIEAAIEAEQNGIAAAYIEEITQLFETKQAGEKKLEDFANDNKEQWGVKKQLALTQGVIGFKTAPHKVVLPEGKTPDEVTGMVQKHFSKYVTITTIVEINKEALIADRDGEQVKQLKKKTGIDIVQDENFYCKPATKELKPAKQKAVPKMQEV